MPKTKPRRKASSTRPTSDYWDRFLQSQGLVGVVSEELEEMPEEEAAPFEVKPSSLSRDQFTFIYRVTERLTPLDGLNPDARRRALKIRKEERQELEDVLNGKIEMTDWFTKARRDANLKEYELVQILYESLEGLRSEEAKELKQQLEGVYRQFVRMRTIGPTG